MPVLRLFAAAREAAGVPRAEIDGSTVGEVLAEARRRFGPDFESVAAASRIWVNGQPADESVPVQSHDVVAVLPPVSGGSDSVPDGGGSELRTGDWRSALRPPDSAVEGSRSFSVDDFATRWRLPRSASTTAVVDRPMGTDEASALRFDFKWPELSLPVTAAPAAPVAPQAEEDDPDRTQAWVGPPADSDADERGDGGAPSEGAAAGEVVPQPVRGRSPERAPWALALAGSEADAPPVELPSTHAAPAAAAAPAPHAAPTAAPVPERPPLSVVHKADRPHGRLGLAWAAVTAAATFAGPAWLAVWLAVVAFTGACQSAKVWRDRHERPMPIVSACTAAGLPVAAGFGLTSLTGVAAAAVAVSLGTRLWSQTKAPARDVALTLALGIPLGLAASAPVLLRHIGVQAPLLLLAYAAVYDAGAYLVGTGASSPWEGPVAGITALVPLTIFSAVVFVPPFSGIAPLVLGVVAGVCAPLGPLAGSALLGDGKADVPGLRRLDSLLVLGPVWAWCAAAFLLKG